MVNVKFRLIKFFLQRGGPGSLTTYFYLFIYLFFGGGGGGGSMRYRPSLQTLTPFQNRERNCEER